MSKLPKVSIVIPVYNGSKYMKEAIDSALNQTYKNIEIIVVNDGSTDNGETDRIAKSYKNMIRYYNKKNGKVASALNYGIKRMEGEYFSWLSHDDVYYPEKIEKQIKFLEKISSKDVILYSDFELIDKDSKVIEKVKLPDLDPSNFRFELVLNSFLHGCTLLIPKEIFYKIGMFNESLEYSGISDYDLWFRIAEYINFIHMPETLVKGRVHEEQVTNTKRNLHIKECNELMIKFINGLSKEEITRGTNVPLDKSFFIIYKSFKDRNFDLAARHLVKNAIFRKKSFFSALLFIYRIFFKKQIFNFFKSPLKSVKNMIRKFIKKIYVCFFKKENIKKKFTNVYKENLFQGDESKSGVGSSMVQTEIIRKEIPKIINELGIKTFLDAPCGDYNWMREVKLRVDRYIGVDVVKDVIKDNKRKYKTKNISFKSLNLIKNRLPKADLILCRDCLVHLNYKNSFRIIKNFKKSGAKYLLTTTFVERNQNVDLDNLFWRTLNLELEPFNFGKPLKIINEGCTEGENKFSDKCLGLWYLKDIKI